MLAEEGGISASIQVTGLSCSWNQISPLEIPLLVVRNARRFRRSHTVLQKLLLGLAGRLSQFVYSRDILQGHLLRLIFAIRSIIQSGTDMFSISSIDSKHSALFDDELPDCVDINGVENGFFELKRVRNSFRKHRARC